MSKVEVGKKEVEKVEKGQEAWRHGAKGVGHGARGRRQSPGVSFSSFARYSKYS